MATASVSVKHKDCPPMARTTASNVLILFVSTLLALARSPHVLNLFVSTLLALACSPHVLNLATLQIIIGGKRTLNLKNVIFSILKEPVQGIYV